MSFQLPRLSELLKSSPLAALEDSFESLASSLGIPVPPGPTKTLASIAESIEEGRGVPSLPLAQQTIQATSPVQAEGGASRVGSAASTSGGVFREF